MTFFLNRSMTIPKSDAKEVITKFQFRSHLKCA